MTFILSGVESNFIESNFSPKSDNSEDSNLGCTKLQMGSRDYRSLELVCLTELHEIAILYHFLSAKTAFYMVHDDFYNLKNFIILNAKRKILLKGK